MTSSETTFNDAELIARLRDAKRDWPEFGHDRAEAADRIEALTKEREQWRRAAETRAKGWKISDDARIEAEAKLEKALEALEALIQLAHDCEKELTEDLHHMDFCGESEPLTKARTTLAEIKGESHE